MAQSRFEYVRRYEMDDSVMPDVWLVVRLDGRGFHRFSDVHRFRKPNDERALNLMNESARQTLLAVPDVRLAYGESDEYSFVLPRHCQLHKRRQSKLVSLFVSVFTAHYVHLWPRFFPDTALQSLPTFDGRVVAYPTDQSMQDYMAWRQADCHINNLYNTCFWALVQQAGMMEMDAEREILDKARFSADKNEMLFSRFGVNYNNLPVMFRRGTILLRHPPQRKSKDHSTTATTGQADSDGPSDRIEQLHDDMIRPEFWLERPWILGAKV